MAEPLTTNLFRFVAVRPVQRVTTRDTERTIIRDGRAANADGIQVLTRLAREIAADGPRARWRDLDLSPLEALVEAHPALVRAYEATGEDDESPDGRELLEETGAERAIEAVEEEDPSLPDLAWDALYIAEASGPDAGTQLETPMAALRVIHYARLVAREDAPSREAALGALRAVPAISPTVSELIRRPAPARQTERDGGGNGSAAPEASDARSARLRELALELNEADRLLEAVTAAPAAVGAPASSGPDVEAGGWTRSEFSVASVPTLRSALTGRITREQASLLDRLRVPDSAPVPRAAQALQSHLGRLSRQAFELSTDPEFLTYQREMGEIAVPIGDALAVDSSWANVAALDDPGTAPEAAVGGRLVPLGIGDLKVVKQTLLQYVPGEVAHIENVLHGETKERKHRKLDRTETTVFTSEEETKETERDTQSTDRFELKREAERTIQEDMSVKAGLTVTAAFGPVVTTATGDFAYSTSKQESQKSSANFARELVERSVSKVQTKIRTERTTKTLSEVEEIATHGVDATDGDGHVTGVYRWVDKRYRAQVHNYGLRLLLEFVVPEPAAFYRAAQIGRAAKEVDATPPPPFVNRKGGPLVPDDITEADYPGYVARFQVAGVGPPPPLYAFCGTSLAKDSLEAGKTIGMATKELVVPEGYTLAFYSATISVVWVNHVKFTLQVGRDIYPLLVKDPQSAASISNELRGVPEEVTHLTGSVPVSVAGYDVVSFAVNVQGICQRTGETFREWQLQTYDKILAAHQALQTAYEQKVAQAEAGAAFVIQGQNPALNRVIERTELKKLCITMMTGQHFKQFDAMTDPSDKPKHYPEMNIDQALEEGPIVQFFEQGFEWEQMTYLFYPYFWGRKRNWVEVSRLSDADPLFGQFLSAGAARVLVPVPMAYADAVQYFLQSKDPDLGKRIWRGGERPTLDSDLYISITDEMRAQTDDLAGATPEGTPWEFTLPTTLVWLQPDPTLPSFV